MFNPYEDLKSYFTFDQRLVILNILNVAKSQKKKTIEGPDVYTNYMKICNKYNIEPVYKNGFMYALKNFEIAGFAQIKAGMRITKLDLDPYTIDDWISAILQSPGFEMMRDEHMKIVHTSPDSLNVHTMERLQTIRDAFKILSEDKKEINLDEIKEYTKIEDPEKELHIMEGRGDIVRLHNNEFRWVRDI